MKTNLNAETADSPHTGQGPRPRIAALTDLVFGLALSIGAISLISKQPANAPDLYLAIAGFGFSFLILIQIWFRFTEIMSIPPRDDRDQGPQHSPPIPRRPRTLPVQQSGVFLRNWANTWSSWRRLDRLCNGHRIHLRYPSYVY